MTSALELRALGQREGIAYPAVFANGSEGETFEQRIVSGAKRFKRAILGRFGSERIVSFDELSETLQRLNMVPLVRDAKEAIHTLVGGRIPYSVSSVGSPYRALRVEKANGDNYIVGAGTYQ